MSILTSSFQSNPVSHNACAAAHREEEGDIGVYPLAPQIASTQDSSGSSGRHAAERDIPFFDQGVEERKVEKQQRTEATRVSFNWDTPTSFRLEKNQECFWSHMNRKES